MKQFGGAMKKPGGGERRSALRPRRCPGLSQDPRRNCGQIEDGLPRRLPGRRYRCTADSLRKKADLLARFDKMGADAKAAGATIKDEASFKAEWPKVASNCGGCHKEYRKPK